MKSIKYPVRKVWRGSAGTLFVSVPPELGVQEGDLLRFKIVDGQIVIEKLEEGS